LASSYLQQFVDLTENDHSQRALLAQACNQLGVLYNKMGEYTKAVTYFDRNFTIACELSKKGEQSDASDDAQGVGVGQSEKGAKSGVMSAHASIGVAQVQLGLSKGNAEMKRFMKYIVDSPNDSTALAALVQWKASRTFMPVQ
jgi:tetratricopeptide (TPR) repeat protein